MGDLIVGDLTVSSWEMKPLATQTLCVFTNCSQCNCRPENNRQKSRPRPRPNLIYRKQGLRYESLYNNKRSGIWTQRIQSPETHVTVLPKQEFSSWKDLNKSCKDDQKLVQPEEPLPRQTHPRSVSEGLLVIPGLATQWPPLLGTRFSPESLPSFWLGISAHASLPFLSVLIAR